MYRVKTLYTEGQMIIFECKKSSYQSNIGNYGAVCSLLSEVSAGQSMQQEALPVRSCRSLLFCMYLIPLVTSQIWMNDVKYNQVLNQTLVPPGVNSQATLQYTKSFKLDAPLPALRTL